MNFFIINNFSFLNISKILIYFQIVLIESMSFINLWYYVYCRLIRRYIITFYLRCLCEGELKIKPPCCTLRRAIPLQHSITEAYFNTQVFLLSNSITHPGQRSVRQNCLHRFFQIYSTAQY